MRRTVLFHILISVTFLSCLPENPNRQLNRISEYYELSELLEENITRLHTSKAGVSKKVSYDGRMESVKSKLDSSGWNEELEYFFSMELNKPQYSGSLIADTTSESGKTIISYSNPDKDDELKFVQLSFESGGIVSVKGKVKSNSFLYQIERNMQLDFNSDRLLEKYHVQGTRKLIFGKAKEFSVTGTVSN